MKYVLGQNLKTFVIRILLFTFLMGFIYIYAENEDAVKTSFASCGWKFSVKTWVDENNNQIWDENEKPLSNVQVFVDSVQSLNDSTYRIDNVGNEAITDQCGFVEFSSFASCGSGEIHELYVKVPPGYKLTTSDKIRVKTHIPDDVFLFGFVEE